MRLSLQPAALGALGFAAPAAAHVPSAAGGSSIDAWISAAAVAVMATAYAIGTARLRRTTGRASAAMNAQIAAFTAGWIVLAIALLSPLDGWGEALFSAHMLQHELLMLVAAPLIVLGRPLPMFAWALPRSKRAATLRGLRQSWLRPLWRSTTSPLIACTLHAAALWGWHAPRAFEAALTSGWAHAAQHASFFATAVLFWWTLLPRAPSALSVVYVLATAIHTGLLGALLTFAPTPLYPSYRDSTAKWGLTPLEDQQLGGLIMWIPAGALLLVAGLLLFARCVDRADRRAALQPGSGT